jgi:hypothetical protein
MKALLLADLCDPIYGIPDDPLRVPISSKEKRLTRQTMIGWVFERFGVK